MRAVWPDDDPTQTEQKMRDLLGSFGLQGEIVEQPVKSLLRRRAQPGRARHGSP